MCRNGDGNEEPGDQQEAKNEDADDWLWGEYSVKGIHQGSWDEGAGAHIADS